MNQVKTSREPLRSDTPVEAKDPKWESYGRRPSTSRRDHNPVVPLHKSPTLEEEDLTSSSSESASDEEDTTASRRGLRFRHFGKFSTHRPGLRDDDDEDDESPAFLPAPREHEDPPPREASGQDLNATLRLESEDPSEQQRRRTEPNPAPRKSFTAESSTSSMSSGAPGNLPSVEARRRVNQATGAFSPRRAADLARLSPRRSVASGRDASDTPSMGSSFSDLDGKGPLLCLMLQWPVTN